MKSETVTVRQLLEERRQYRVPFYQRAYVWQKEEQWEPLWLDIAEKAERRLSGNQPPPHFLGAIVLEPQQQVGLKGVNSFHIIDGQQRLTTLQYFFAALAMAMRENGIVGILSIVEGCIWNSNPDTMVDPKIERFKLWPTFRDRVPFENAMTAETRDMLKERFPLHFTRAGTLAKNGVDHPAALETIWYFRDLIEEWLQSNDNSSISNKLEALTQAGLTDLKLVSISLEQDDDAQVIFETLNGRGAELDATDLIRNFIFMRADRENLNAAELYETLWSPFEGQFWTDKQRRGRLSRKRLEWFTQTALQVDLAEEVEIGKLYASYRRYALGRDQAVPANAQLGMLSSAADAYRELISGTGDTPLARFGRQVEVWDASTTHALALRIGLSTLSNADKDRMLSDIISYLVRRAVCNLGAKNYNNVFLQILKRMSGGAISPDTLHAALSEMPGRATRWPRDDEFRVAWMTGNVHSRIGDVARIRQIFTVLENGLRSERSEEPFIAKLDTLDIDHVMPDKWYEHWPLNGNVVTANQASEASLGQQLGVAEEHPLAEAITRREQLKATFGNLTLIHYGINRSLQNGPFLKSASAYSQYPTCISIVV